MLTAAARRVRVAACVGIGGVGAGRSTPLLLLAICAALQGCRMRNTKTEYVSCPSCGRTLFDLQARAARGAR